MLTKKEIEVLELRKEGLLQSEIASRLKISQPAVSNFLNNAYAKIKDAKLVVEKSKKLGVKIEE